MNVLIMSHLLAGKNRIFEDYCTGVRANCEQSFYVDYRLKYLQLGKDRFEQHVKKLIQQEKIDWIIFLPWSGDMTVDPRFLKLLAEKCGLIINFFDTEYYFEAVDRYYGQAADLVILPDYLSRFKFELLGIPCLTTFSLFDQYHYQKIDSTVSDIDVSFVGNICYSDRKAAIDYLQANGIHIESFGAGSENGFVQFDEMISIFNRSKINLNFTGTQGTNLIIDLPAVTGRIKQAKGRPIEIALCGGFVLSAYSPGIEEMFRIGEEIDIFHTDEELITKIRYYLENDAERKTMAMRAHERALREYDCREGFKRVFAYASSRSSEKTMLLDRNFLRNYSEYHIHIVGMTVVLGAFRRAVRELPELTGISLLRLGGAWPYLLKGIVMALEKSPRIWGWVQRLKNILPLKVRY